MFHIRSREVDSREDYDQFTGYVAIAAAGKVAHRLGTYKTVAFERIWHT